ncbi:hypothetical protein EZJ49_04515 [Bdellovibrio bacteriovorus]|uniref:hypothetical protein n=1 Tax=Bdellovibrio bacteriovorus TaxID=959 RepID=UPI0021D240CD|nr:hypothetical protein [Bdellovibrio bacteriovorus]UXR65516.1 hypothetical protein EZJ49_04515 [Bdellovibrio bacteriovorus]
MWRFLPVLFIAFSPLAGAQVESEALSEESVEQTTSAQKATAYLEGTRELLSSRVIRLSESVDSLFGNTRADDQKNTSTLRVSQTYYIRRGNLGADDPGTSLNLFLPNLKRWEKAVQDKMQLPQRNGGSADEAVVPAAEEEERLWDLNSETGLVVAIPVNYFARLRLRRSFLLGYFENSFFEQIGWSKKDEWEERTSLTTDYAFSRDLLFRFVNEANWAMTNRDFDTHHGPSLIRTLSEHSALSQDFRYNTKLIGRAIYSESFVLSSTFTQRMPMQWIYVKTTPSLSWSRSDGFTPAWALYMTVELVFGNEDS